MKILYICLSGVVGSTSSILERTVTMAEAESEITALVDSVENRVPVSSRFWRTSLEQVDRETIERIGGGVEFKPANLKDAYIPIPSANHLLKVWPKFMSSSTSVLEVVGQSHEFPPLVLVYRQYCPHPLFPLDSTAVDYWFLKYLEGTDLAPRAYYLSAPWAGPDGSELESQGLFSILRLEGKLQVQMCKYKYPLEPPVVRYILMEQLRGHSVNDVANSDRGLDGKVPVRIAARMGLYMVRHLEKLHALNVVHGDAHHENFILDPKTKTVRLIDFELARIFNPDEEYEYPDGCPITADLITRIGHEALVLSALYSPWESRQCTRSFRDDIHKVLVSIAALIHGDAYVEYFQNVALGASGGVPLTNPRTVDMYRTMWMNHRFKGHIFTVNGFQTSITEHFPDFRTVFVLGHANMPTDKVGWVSEKLHALQDHVMGLGIAQRPDYGWIKHTLAEIHNGLATK